MKKTLIYTILFLILLILFKYFLADYKIQYKLNGYNIKTKYNDERFYIEISGDKEFNFDIYKKRSLKKLKIEKIIEISDKDLFCIYPKIKGINTYPLCYLGDEYVDYNLIDNDLLYEYKIKYEEQKSKKDFVYYNALDKNVYAALWNYKGYIVMHDDTYETANIFKKDHYSNDLAYLYKNYIYTPNYDQIHEYDELVEFDLKTLKNKIIKLDYKIDYDSYVVGTIKNKLYIFDNKYSRLYEINLNNYKISIVGNNEKGFKKYVDGKYVSCSKNEYKINKYKINTNNSYYKYDLSDNIYKVMNENDKLKQKIVKGKSIYINENNNSIFYINKNNVYEYNPEFGSKTIFYNYELEFNNENTVFIYID